MTLNGKVITNSKNVHPPDQFPDDAVYIGYDETEFEVVDFKTLGAEKDIDLFVAKRKEIGVVQGMWTRFYSLATLGAMAPGDFTETQPAGVHLEMDLFERSTMNY